MAQSKFYYDTRNPRVDGTAPLKIMVSHQRKTFLISLKVYLLPYQWTGERIERHPNMKCLNSLVKAEKARIDNILYDLSLEGRDDIPMSELKGLLIPGTEPVHSKNKLAEYFRNYCTKCRKPKTAQIYLGALKKIREFVGEAKFEGLTFEEINKDWLSRFQASMMRTCCLNTCNIHFRSLRAVFNDAIDNDVTKNYPFRNFRMKTVRTPKRSLSVEALREFFNYPCEYEQKKYLDMFKLIFMFIGINTIDLFNLDRVIGERIEYTRSKTYRLYSIRVEPEAMELINKYRGSKKLLDIADRYISHDDYRRRLNKELREIGPITVGKRGKKTHTPLQPQITSYWARHSWATIAASLDIPKETIAAALGHGGNTVTDIYIDFDQHKVDEANRRVIDWVLYGKK